MLKIENLSITLGKNTKSEAKILNNISFNIMPGECINIIGNNGAGKSTLFNALLGNIAIDKGKISINNKDITEYSAKKRIKYISNVLQDPDCNTNKYMTIEENLTIAYLKNDKLSLKPYFSNKRNEYFKDKLALLNMGLENMMSERAGSLSGGQRQALSLIMMIISKAKLLLLDEVTSALDPKMADFIMKLFYEIIKMEKLMAIVITHNTQNALKYADRTLFLSEGIIKQEFINKNQNVNDILKLFQYL